MDTLLQIVRQEDVEKRFNRKLIDVYIREAIDSNPDTQKLIDKGVGLLNEWLSGSYYDSKNARLAQVKILDIRTLVTDLFVGIAYVWQPQLFTSVTAQMAGRLGWDDKRDAILTIAEILSVLCLTDAFDIGKADKMASLHIVSRIHLPDEVVNFIQNSEYLPPMVCVPLELESNYDSGYLSHTDSLILGKNNHHDGNICLDVLNRMNKVALKLDTDFLRAVEEEPTFDLDTSEKRDMWLHFKSMSARIYMLMHDLGNQFHLTHKVDKRGRIYAMGYHIHTQGTAYKKAMVEFAKEEIIEGVPSI
jgi:hypothetical protein